MTLKYLLLILTMFVVSSCSHFQMMDRSLLNTKLMDLTEYKKLETLSPHTNLKATSGEGSGGCSVCAH